MRCVFKENSHNKTYFYLLTAILFFISNNSYSANLPPVIEIDPPGEKIVYIDESLSFTVQAHDPDGDHVEEVTTDNVPPGASFEQFARITIYPNPDSGGRFTWTPYYGQEGNYFVSFHVSDAFGWDIMETIEITVIGGPRPTSTTSPTPWIRQQEVAIYPNPARREVSFACTITGPGKITIDCYRLSGERVAHIVEQLDGGAGQTLRTAWQAAEVAPGVYICQIVIRDSSGRTILSEKKKVVIIK